MTTSLELCGLAGLASRGENARIETQRARFKFRAHIAIAAVTAACACSNPPEPATRAQLDARLARAYQSACASCHARPGTGAPLVGDDRDWRARRAKGLDVLVANTVNGYRGMPPLGTCGLCSEQDLRGLAAYLAGL